MLESLAILLLCAMALATIAQRLHLPRLLGMLITGVILGPFFLNLISPELLNLSADLRKIALVVILLRAGLSLDIGELREVGRPAILMCFVPACCEILGTLLLAPRLLGLSLIESAVLGSVIAAVSPAVVVPAMLNLFERRLGTEQRIPQLILAGASADDVFVLVLFTIFSGLAQSGELSLRPFLELPAAIVLGIVGGIIVGLALSKFFKAFHMRDTIKVLVILSAAFLLISLEDHLAGIVPFSGMLSVMAMGLTLRQQYIMVANRMAAKFSKIWVGAEILLFVLVGAAVDPKYAVAAGGAAVLMLAGALVFRCCGVLLCLLRTPLTRRERLFCTIAYTPKATVQAAIGPMPLAMGLACGHTVLTVAVLSILITAPLGALAISCAAPRLLRKASDAPKQAPAS